MLLLNAHHGRGLHIVQFAERMFGTGGRIRSLLEFCRGGFRPPSWVALWRRPAGPVDQRDCVRCNYARCVIEPAELAERIVWVLVNNHNIHASGRAFLAMLVCTKGTLDFNPASVPLNRSYSRPDISFSRGSIHSVELNLKATLLCRRRSSGDD